MKKINEILESIMYCTLATVCKDGSAWSSPLTYGYDESYNIYWVSSKKNIHSCNIAINPAVFITVFDSQAVYGLGEGVYLKGKAEELINKTDIKAALGYTSKRSPTPIETNWQEFDGSTHRRAYKFSPESIWINGDGEEDGVFIDIRIEVS